ncbi:uncharacterized protein LOC123528276 [Mercenaria mercenaria]|uniref:uncharacterized protein LOC123528276 n=1 Tax=Mercenaria mercenaria TaxID=6596 RepID=UPI00234FB2E4|nr:uncharacterized protein LOC123528276 [Mercenaria mercenaria]
MMKILLAFSLVALTLGLSPQFNPDMLQFPVQSSSATPGSPVGTSYASADNGQPVTYSLVHGDSEYFSIDASSGEITFSNIDPSGKVMMVFSVKAVDSNGMESYQPVAVWFEDLLVNTC